MLRPCTLLPAARAPLGRATIARGPGQRAAEPGGRAQKARIAVRRWVVTGGECPVFVSRRSTGGPSSWVCGRSTAGVVRLPEWPAINSSPMSVKGVEALGAANMVTRGLLALDDHALIDGSVAQRTGRKRCVRTGDPPGAPGCHCCGHREHDYRRHDLGKRGHAGEDGRYPIVLSFSLEAEIHGTWRWNLSRIKAQNGNAGPPGS